MSRIVVGLFAGVLFGLGLTVSQMINPAKVIAFLDVAGDWDPSLMLVLASAVAVAAAGFAVAGRCAAPLCDTSFSHASSTRIDLRLIAGAALFGVGWGLVGFCPGPALASLSVDGLGSAIFVTAMLAGMVLFAWLDRWLLASRRPT